MTRVVQPVIFLCYFIATICAIVWTMMGFALTALYRIKGWPDEVRSWNCWTFAFAKWLEKGPRNNYLIVRLSRHTWVSHVFFAESIEGLQVEELKPVDPKKGWRGLMRVFRHKSKIRKGRGEENREN